MQLQQEKASSSKPKSGEKNTFLMWHGAIIASRKSGFDVHAGIEAKMLQLEEPIQQASTDLLLEALLLLPSYCSGITQWSICVFNHKFTLQDTLGFL